MEGKDVMEKLRERVEEFSPVVKERFKNNPELSADENTLQHYKTLLKRELEEDVQEKEDWDEWPKREAMVDFCFAMLLHLDFLQKPEYRRLNYVVRFQTLLLKDVPSYSDREWYHELLVRLLYFSTDPNPPDDSDGSEDESLFINMIKCFVDGEDVTETLRERVEELGPVVKERFKNDPELSANKNTLQHYKTLRELEEVAQEEEDRDEVSKRATMIDFCLAMLLRLDFLQKPEYRRLNYVVRFQTLLLKDVPSYSDRERYHDLLVRLLNSFIDPNPPDDSDPNPLDDSEDDASQDEDNEESKSSTQSALRRVRAALEKTVKKLSKLEAQKKHAEEQHASESCRERLAAKIAQLTKQKDRLVTTVDELETELALERILQTTVASRSEDNQV